MAPSPTRARLTLALFAATWGAACGHDERPATADLPAVATPIGPSLPQYAPGALVVQYRGSATPLGPGSLEAARAPALSPYLGGLHERFALRQLEPLLKSAAFAGPVRLSFDAAPDDLEALAREYARDPGVAYAHPDYLLDLAAIPNDARYAEQWALPKVSAPAGWDLSTGSTGVVIAVIDSGVDWNHPDLAANIWTNPGETAGDGVDNDSNGFVDDVRGWDFVDVGASTSWAAGEDVGPPDNDPMDFLGHGTLVAGAAAAIGNNATGVAGVCWRCKILPLRVGVTSSYPAPLQGRSYVLSTWVAAAIDYAIQAGVEVINLSMTDNNWPGLVKDAIDRAHQADIVVVASASNHGEGAPNFPAAYGDVIGVASTDRNDQRAVWGTPQPPLYQGQSSSFGPWVDVAAPGTDILATNFDNAYATASGTSISTAMVSGLAGLYRSLRPGLNRTQVAQVIKSTTDPVAADEYIGTGRINVARALAMTGVPTAVLAAPAHGTTLGGTSASVTGSAGGSGFASYTLRFGSGLYPTSWTTIRTAASAVSNGTLGTWDLAPLADNQRYTLELVVTDVSGNSARARALIILQKAVPSGWPKVVGEYQVGDGVAIANVDPSDAALEIAVAGRRNLGNKYTHDLHLLNHDGSEVVGWPVTDLNEWLSGPTLADVTGDGAPEIIAQGYNWGITSPLTFHVFSRSGAYLAGWPQTVDVEQGMISAAPSVGDLDGNGTLEIVFPSEHDSASGTAATAHIHVYRFDGTVMPGWPKDINLGFPDGMGTAVHASHASLGDLDGDGRLEVVVGIATYPNSRLLVLRSDGTTMAGWPVAMPDGFPPIPVLGDIDGDGRLDIVASRGSGVVGVWRSNGTPLAGWPQAVPFGGASAPALADLDGDRRPEIIVNTTGDQVFAYRFDGSQLPGWPVAGPAKLGGLPWPMPLVADVTGDGRPEVVQGSGDDALIYAWQASGQPVPGWPKTVSSEPELAPALGDVDRDGGLDLVVSTLGTVTLMELGVAPAAMHWPMSWHDAAHSGRYAVPALRGDLNADGAVNTADLQLLVNVLLGTETSPAVITRADLNGDGRATTSDLQLLVNLLLGI